MNELIKYFPKEVAVPYRIECKDSKEFFRTVDRHNGKKKKIYFSLYDTKKIMIDKIGFDFDSKDSIKNLITFHNWCQKYHYKHLLIFSTGGFWGYIFTKNYEKLKHKKNALKEAQLHICKKCSFSVYDRNDNGFFDNKINDIDFHLIGNIRQVGRMPNTFDKSRGLFCIPVTISDLRKGIDHIREKAKHQCFDYVYYGDKHFDISKFDKEPTSTTINMKTANYDVDLSRADAIVKLFLPCVQTWLLEEGKDTWEARFYFAIYCRDFGLSKGACNALAKKYFNSKRHDGLGTNYDHFVKCKVIDYAYRENMVFPTCEMLYSKGLCKGRCKKYGQMYK